jgi:hypothetical protein
MPSEQEHLTQARHNEAFVQSLGIQAIAYLDWAVTGIFYAALHYIEAFLATQSVHSPAHRSRETLFRRFPQLNPIYSEYRTLKDDSEGARYRLEVFTAHEVQALLDNELATIKRQLSYP